MNKSVLIFSTLFLSTSIALADNLSDSNKLFNWAESEYPQFFYPPGMTTYKLFNEYLGRFYPNTKNYIGTLGEEVYVYGEDFPTPQKVGVITDFINPEEITTDTTGSNSTDNSQTDTNGSTTPQTTDTESTDNSTTDTESENNDQGESENTGTSDDTPTEIPVLSLQEQLELAQPGGIIEFSGVSIGSIATYTAGTLENPITIRGIGNAVIQGDSIGSKKGLSIFHDNYIIENIKIENFQKGLWIESASNVTVDNLTIDNIGHEGVKIRRGSTYVTIRNTNVSNTGMTKEFTGESFYVGDSSDNWIDTNTPDTSSYITFENCTSINATSNGFDFKEGSFNIKVKDSTVQNAGDASFYTRANNVQFINTASIDNISGYPAFKLYQEDVNGVRYGYNIELKEIKVDNHLGPIVHFHRKDIAESSSLYDDYQASINGAMITADKSDFWGSSTKIDTTSSSAFIEMQW